MRFLGILLSTICAVCIATADPTPSPTPAKLRKITLVTHESVPYMSNSMPEQGAAAHSLRKIFKKMGYDLNVVIVGSWERAKYMAANDFSIDGYFPYTTVENKELFVFSDGISKGLWVLIERKANPIHWKKLEDLGKYIGGNVVGVELRGGMQELLDQKKLTIEDAPDNISNLRKLATKRIDYALMNPPAFIYHINTEPTLARYKDKLQVNPKIIAKNTYGVAFRKTRFDSEFMKEFNKLGLDVDKFGEEYIMQLLNKKK